MGKTAARDYKPNKELLRTEYLKVWGNDSRMIDYCVNHALAMATLPDGSLIEVEKRTIKKTFCYDDSYDYEGAQDMAENARTNVNHLKVENMRYFDEWLNDFNDPRYILCISKNGNYGGKANIKYIDCLTRCDLEDWRGKEMRPATDEEKAIIIDLYTYAREQHEKKVDSYIKRYGTSKVESWTYWGMA